MSFLGSLSRCVVLASVVWTMSGCLPTDSGQQAEEKEQHYVLGKARVNSLDYEGAVDAFKQSLEVNPRSAAAHYQLALLYDNDKQGPLSDPAAAIYHFQEYLRLNPKAENAEVVKQRIYSCKQQLAADTMLLPSTPAAQKQLEDLAEKNRQLQAELDKWRAYAAQSTSQRTMQTDPGYTSVANPRTVLSGGSQATPSRPFQPTGAQPPPRAKTHVVAAGDTMAAIARKHGVSLSALTTANPGVTPTKLKVGQTINVP